MPTSKYKGFCAGLQPHGKIDLCKGYWNLERKMEVVMHFMGIISLERNKNSDISIFLKEEGKDISSQIFLDSPLHTDKQTHCLKRS